MGDYLDRMLCDVLLGTSGWRSGHQSRLPPQLQCCMWNEFPSLSTWLRGFSHIFNIDEYHEWLCQIWGDCHLSKLAVVCWIGLGANGTRSCCVLRELVMTKIAIFTERDQFGQKHLSIRQNWCVPFAKWLIWPANSDRWQELQVSSIFVNLFSFRSVSTSSDHKTGSFYTTHSDQL